MRTSQYLLCTLKETPHDAEIISHKLMLRAGIIRKMSSGLYLWLPTGIKILNKIKKIIKKEMNTINALEVSIPIIQPESLWTKSGRLSIYGAELLKFSDRRKNNFILSPTNEEIVTDFINKEIHSYKALPMIIYQIKTKFRDEIRPRFGAIRSREFNMKDAYSFHVNSTCLKKTYQQLYNSYIKIFNRIKLKIAIVQADSGSMGGSISHEFQALSVNGEDQIAFSRDMSYAKSIDMAQSQEATDFFKDQTHHPVLCSSKTSKKLVKVSDLSSVSLKNQIKTLFVHAQNHDIISAVALLIRGDHELNTLKLEKIKIIKQPVSFLTLKEIILLTGVKKEFSGPIGLKIPIISDVSAYKMKNFTISANIENYLFINANWGIDIPVSEIQDIRKVTKNDYIPNKNEFFNIEKSIEVGHIFQLGTQYSKRMKTSFKEKNGLKKNFYMGCYGIGITRIIASVIEQNHDERGIIWPISIAPFELVILPLYGSKFPKVKNVSNMLYQQFKLKKIDVILDDRNERPGVMFNDMDLIGIPYQIIISDNYLQKDKIEYRERGVKKSIFLSVNNTINFILKKIER